MFAPWQQKNLDKQFRDEENYFTGGDEDVTFTGDDEDVLLTGAGEDLHVHLPGKRPGMPPAARAARPHADL